MFDRGAIMTTSFVALFAAAQVAENLPFSAERNDEIGYLAAEESFSDTTPASPRFSVNRAHDGLFHITALVNGKPVDMAIDTGATRSVIAQSDANRIGLVGATGRYSTMQTLNGRVQLQKVQLSQLKIGQTTIRNLEVAVGPHQLAQSVIGLDALRQSGPILIEADQLTVLGDAERRP
jgi:aspartyl protease family protein